MARDKVDSSKPGSQLEKRTGLAMFVAEHADCRPGMNHDRELTLRRQVDEDSDAIVVQRPVRDVG